MIAQDASQQIQDRNLRRLNDKLQGILDRLNLPLKVVWVPNGNMVVHGEIKGNVIFLYDPCEKEAWQTFTHEVTEFKLQTVTRPYRVLINNLIEAVEKIIYAEKEQFIDFLPRMIEVIKESQLEGEA